MGSALRVLQAADLKLHEPLESVGSLTASLREIFNQARERTALRLFDAAIEQRAHVLLLSGVLANYESEPRLACFLMEQFRRLQAAGVRVVWATEKASLLPVWSLRPEHVSCLLPGQSTLIKTASGNVLVHHALPQHAKSAAMTNQFASHDLVITISDRSPVQTVEFTERGGEAALRCESVPVQHAGPDAQGPCGMRITEKAAGRPLHSRLIPIHAVQWISETIDVGDHFAKASLIEEIHRRAQQHLQGQSSEVVCFEWIFTGAGPLWDELIEDRNQSELLREIRQGGPAESTGWTWKIHFHPSADQYRTWGDFAPVAEGLRQLDQLSTSDLAATANVPGSSGTFLKGPVMLQSDLGQFRPRLVRELRTPLSVNNGSSQYF